MGGNSAGTHHVPVRCRLGAGREEDGKGKAGAVLFLLSPFALPTHAPAQTRRTVSSKYLRARLISAVTSASVGMIGMPRGTGCMKISVQPW